MNSFDMNIYYTYAYLREDGTPYYIGKGRGNRINCDHRHIPVPPKSRRLFLKTNLTEGDAYKHEEYLISVFGRKLDGGILINLMSGGGAPAHSKETKIKIREARARQVFTQDVHDRRAKSNTGKKRTQEQKDNIMNGQRKDPVTFVSPEGKEHTTTLVSLFCREHGLTHTNMCKVMSGKRKSHKGWTVR